MCVSVISARNRSLAIFFPLAIMCEYRYVQTEEKSTDHNNRISCSAIVSMHICMCFCWFKITLATYNWQFASVMFLRTQTYEVY